MIHSELACRTGNQTVVFIQCADRVYSFTGKVIVRDDGQFALATELLLDPAAVTADPATGYLSTTLDRHSLFGD